MNMHSFFSGVVKNRQLRSSTKSKDERMVIKIGLHVMKDVFIILTAIQ